MSNLWHILPNHLYTHNKLEVLSQSKLNNKNWKNNDDSHKMQFYFIDFITYFLYVFINCYLFIFWKFYYFVLV